MRRSTAIRLLSLILCLALILTYDLPVAGELDLPSDTVVQGNETALAEDTSLMQGVELPEKRTANTRQYLIANKTFEAIVYGESVNYLAADGTWQPIDNRLVRTTATDGAAVYENRANGWTVRLSATTGDAPLVEVAKAGKTVRWRLSGQAADVVPEISTGMTDEEYAALTPGEQRQTPRNLYVTVTYRGLVAGCDVQYVIGPSGIRENLVLENREAATELSSEIELDGLTLAENRDGGYDLLDEAGQPFLKFPAAYAQDADGERDPGFTTRLEDLGRGRYILHASASTEWLDTAKYPVTLDPDLTSVQQQSAVRDAFVSQQYPTTNYQYGELLHVGRTSSGRYYTFIKFVQDDLPAFTASQRVYRSELRLYRKVTNTSLKVTAHRVEADWDSSTITWNNKPGYDTDTVEDYATVYSAGYKYWDITNLAREWIESTTNYGVMLKEQTDAVTYRQDYYCSDYWDENKIPLLILHYTDHAGIEDCWSFHGYALSHGGSLAVNDYTGNTVFSQSLASTPGSLAPASLGLVFNGSSRNVVDAKLGWGKGWRSVYDQKVYYTTIGTNPAVPYYVYIDGDGTTHWFYSYNSTWINEEGLDLTLLPSENLGGTSYLTITDKGGNKLVFYLLNHATLPGRLKEVRDGTGQANRTIELVYTGYGTPAVYCLTAVKDGTDKQITITRQSSGMIDKVTDPASRETDLTVDANGYLTKVQFPYSSGEPIYDTDFTYDANGNLSTATDCDNKRYTITYASNPYYSGYNYRVSQVQESETATSTSGGTSVFAFGLNTTTVTDESDRETVYQFNTLGNCLNVTGPDGSAGFAKYGDEMPGQDGGVYSTRNKPTQTSQVQKFVPNKAKNHGFETSSDWTFYVDPSNDGGSVARATDQKYSGAYALKVVKGMAVNYNYAIQSITAEKGKTYTFSAYVKTSGISGTSSGAVLEATWYNSGGGRNVAYSRYTQGTADWTRQSVTFTVPSDATSATVTIACQIRAQTGTAWFDCVQLEEGKVPNRFNLVENPDFDYATSGLPTFWTRSASYGSNDIVLTSADATNPPLSSDSRYQIEGSLTQDKYLEQTIAVSGGTSDTFVIGGWAKGYAIPQTTPADQSPVRDFSVRVGFVGSSTQWVEAKFNPSVSGWQYASAAAVPTAAFTSIKVQVRYSAGMNNVCFDGVQLYEERFGSEYVYDANGNLTDTTGANGSGSAATYTNNDLTNVTLPAGGDIDYTYDSYHRPTGATSATGVLFGMTYDGTTGHLTASKEGSATTYVRSTSEYSAATGYESRYLTKVTDPFGKQVQYDYELTRGLNTSVTQPNGQVISHTYQTSSGLLTGTSATVTGLGTVTNGYAYGNNSRITEIRHNTAGADVVYGFAYNALGWLTGVTVGGSTLVTNSYEDHSGRLNSVAYGNSQTVNYSYDAFDRVVGVSLGTTQKYAFDYDATGQVGYLDDKVQNKQYWYLSDLAGRLSEIRRSDGNSTRYTYNASNQVTAFNETISGTNYSTTYSYDNDQRMTALASGLLAVSVGYDTVNSLDRVLTSTRAYNGVNKITTTYGYQAGATGQSITSKRIASVTNGSKAAIGYAYDDNGNIATITQGSDVREYFYDGLNQLKRENVSVAGATPYTRTFSYDVGGNILSKSTYSYVAGNTTLGTLQSTDTYVYGDTSWKDKLTTYNGVAMTYDGIGNPLTWTDPNGAWTATWTMGRQLASLSKTGTTISYKYGADGIRTEKTVNGVTTVYNVVGGVVTWEKTGTNPAIHYTYDANGQLFSLEYNGSSWFYVRNAQNDVIGLVEASTGSWAVQYVYDAWGKPLAVLDGSGNDVSGNTSHIANVNPYRYRGYRFDAESGLYYLNSRYYSQNIGRCISADTVISDVGKSILGNNLYSYCLNNPINLADDSGHWPKWIGTALKILAAVAIVALVTAAIVITAGAAAAVLGASAAIVQGVCVGATIGGVVGGTTNIASQVITKKGDVNLKEVASNSAFGAIAGAIGGGMSAVAPSIGSGASSGARILAQKGMQAAGNAAVSNSIYMMQSAVQGEPITLRGLGIATLGGLIGGCHYNDSIRRSVVTSFSISLAGSATDETLGLITDPIGKK